MTNKTTHQGVNNAVRRNRQRVVAGFVAVALATSLTGCAQIGKAINGEDKASSQNNGEKVVATQAPKPTFQAKQVPPQTKQKPGEIVKDEGLNVEWRILAAVNGVNGGTTFKVMVKNLSEEVAVPTDAVNSPKLAIPGNNNVGRVKTEGDGLDLPLGPGATTVVNYSFNTNPYNLSNSTLTLGNVEFTGYLNL